MGSPCAMCVLFWSQHRKTHTRPRLTSRCRLALVDALLGHPPGALLFPSAPAANHAAQAMRRSLHRYRRRRGARLWRALECGLVHLRRSALLRLQQLSPQLDSVGTLLALSRCSLGTLLVLFCDPA